MKGYEFVSYVSFPPIQSFSEFYHSPQKGVRNIIPQALYSPYQITGELRYRERKHWGIKVHTCTPNFSAVFIFKNKERESSMLFFLSLFNIDITSKITFKKSHFPPIFYLFRVI